MKKFNAIEARRLLEESRNKKADERKQAAESLKAEKLHQADIRKKLKLVLDKALEAAMHNKSCVVIDEETYDLIENSLVDLGYAIETIQISKNQEEFLTGELSELSEKQLKAYAAALQNALERIRRSAISYDESEYLGEVEACEKHDDPVQNVVALINTLGKISNFYEEDTAVELQFDAQVGVALQDIKLILDRHYDACFDDDYEETGYEVSWSECYKLPEDGFESSLMAANKLCYIASQSYRLFQCVEKSVSNAIDSNKSFFHIDALSDETDTTITFPNGVELEIPLSVDDFVHVLEMLDYRCDVSKPHSRSGVLKIKVSF